jgi:hypothetical protein
MDNDDKSTSQPIDEEEQEELESTSEETTEDVVEEVEETQEDVEPEVDEAPAEEEKPPSRRENLRIQQLISKIREQDSTPTAPVIEGMDYRTKLEADDETVKTLEEDRQKYGQVSYQEGLKQAQSIQFHTRLEIDAPRVESKYPELDSKSENFNPALADAVNQWYLATAGYDPQSNQVQNANVRYMDFVEGIMEMADEIAGQKVQKTQKNIAKQAANTGLRPDGSSAKTLNLNKAPQDMTDEELEAVIKTALPRK